jgi:hypothetical protein
MLGRARRGRGENGREPELARGGVRAMFPCGRLRVTCTLAPASMRALRPARPGSLDGRAGQVGEVGVGLFADLPILAVGLAQDTAQQSEPA